MDARLFCPIFEIPLLKIRACPTDTLLESLAKEASLQFVENPEIIPALILNEFKITEPKVVTGLVITGDQEFLKRVFKRTKTGRLVVRFYRGNSKCPDIREQLNVG